MMVDFAASTHAGRVRKNNEDAYLVSPLDGNEPCMETDRRATLTCRVALLAAVADGMGGAAAGEIASREGLNAFALYLFGHWARFPEEANAIKLTDVLKKAAQASSDAVLRYTDDDRSARGMGSTLTAAIIWDGFAYLCQVGDSRVYLFRQGVLQQLTQDQTLVQDLIAEGAITPEEARTHPQRSMITQALGCPMPLQAVLGKVALRRGDRLLLCTDGLHGELSDTRIQTVMSRGLSPRTTVEALLEGALERGGRDNITVLLLHLDDPELPLAAPNEGVKVLDPLQTESRTSFRFGRFFSD